MCWTSGPSAVAAVRRAPSGRGRGVRRWPPASLSAAPAPVEGRRLSRDGRRWPHAAAGANANAARKNRWHARTARKHTASGRPRTREREGVEGSVQEHGPGRGCRCGGGRARPRPRPEQETAPEKPLDEARGSAAKAAAVPSTGGPRSRRVRAAGRADGRRKVNSSTSGAASTTTAAFSGETAPPWPSSSAPARAPARGRGPWSRFSSSDFRDQQGNKHAEREPERPRPGSGPAQPPTRPGVSPPRDQQGRSRASRRRRTSPLSAVS